VGSVCRHCCRADAYTCGAGTARRLSTFSAAARLLAILHRLPPLFSLWFFYPPPSRIVTTHSLPSLTFGFWAGSSTRFLSLGRCWTAYRTTLFGSDDCLRMNMTPPLTLWVGGCCRSAHGHDLNNAALSAGVAMFCRYWTRGRTACRRFAPPSPVHAQTPAALHACTYPAACCSMRRVWRFNFLLVLFLVILPCRHHLRHL